LDTPSYLSALYFAYLTCDSFERDFGRHIFGCLPLTALNHKLSS